ncbi:MAG: serine protease [Flavipsychrobacter sp.]
MPGEKNIWEIAEGYVAGSLNETELTILKNKLSDDITFSNTFYECVNTIRSLEANGKQHRFKSLLKDVHQKRTVVAKPEPKTISINKHYWRTAAVAAGIALVTSLSTYLIIANNNKRIASQYSLLKRDLEKYKRSQHRLINNITGEQQQPSLDARYSGTGFALSNDGYLVTNYHVTADADSVYIQHNDGNYYKAAIISTDQEADIAILKVVDKKFKFSKWGVPYLFAKSKKKLGEQVYSLGYPQDEVVYNEGYISSVNGYMGDSSQYRLELPANHGQSGAPVVNTRGEVIAIITGKESQSEGTTYAISSEALLQHIKELPDSTKIDIPSTNRLSRLNRERQIERLSQYTCAIKVYKK